MSLFYDTTVFSTFIRKNLNFKLTHHAENALVKRKIEKKWLEQVLAFPQRIEPDATDPMLEHRLAVISLR